MGLFAEFLNHPRKIGAIAPSGKRLSEKMMMPIDFASVKAIIEYGPGTGSFTKELVTWRRSDTLFLPGADFTFGSESLATHLRVTEVVT